MKNRFLTLTFAAALGASLAGCTEQSKQEYSQAGDNLSKAADKIGDAASKDAAVAGEKMKEGTAKATLEAGDVAMTGKVKGALLSANGVDASQIDVDTANRVVHLKGVVRDDQQKTNAGEIAKQQAGNDFTVSNELIVGPAVKAADTSNQPKNK